MKAEIITNITRNMNKTKLWGKKHSPEILIGAGIAGIACGVIAACKATLLAKESVDYAKIELDELHTTTTDSEVVIDENGEFHTAVDENYIKKETAKIYGKTALKVAYAYAPAAIMLTLSIAGVIGSHKILKTRNVALAAAYTTLDGTFKSYRGRVAEKYGDEVENDIFNGFSTMKVPVESVDENGETKVSKEKVKILDPNLTTPYSVYYDTSTSPYATENSDFNRTSLVAAENSANMYLRTFGHYTMDMLYRQLGIKSRPEALVVGWVYDENNEIGDNEIKLNIQECYLDNHDGTFKRTYCINPNYDGLIYDRI